MTLNLGAKYITIFVLAIVPLWCMAQLSPGKLTTAHQELEGLSNCTQCHDLGNKVPDQKCLACHDEISSLIRADRGFHASREVTEKTCVDCHSEHHGRKFEIARFDESNFNHESAGYSLEGQHAIIDCRQCHQSDNISDADLRGRENTFLGLSNECLSCHDDFHQGSLSKECLSCHGFDAFRPADKFNHDEADFPLTGAHVDVDCIKCHPSEQRNGVEFQKFNDIGFVRCNSCHDDVHRGNLPVSCTQCHSDESFKKFIGQKRFNHNQTNFTLNGAHKEVNCFECHNRNVTAPEIFQDRLGISVSACATCHEDVHDGKFGNECAKCHTETSFLSLKNMDQFNHDVTDFPLIGLHQEVDCKSCHQSNFTEEIDFSACRNCHDDYHEGEFSERIAQLDCKACHEIERPFDYTTYGQDQHQLSAFPLEGGHLATPCFACHVSEEKWLFNSTGNQCIDCHDNIHDGFIPKKYDVDQGCVACHTTENWNAVTFDHTQTNWALEGSHLSTDCRACHFKNVANGPEFTQHFIELNSDCASCHLNPHDEQFEQDGVTSCARCHNSNDWFPSNFDHDQTAFPLEGKHTEVNCKACHSDTYQKDGKTQRNFKLNSFECVDCHG